MVARPRFCFMVDAMRVALKREEYLKNLLGPNADEECGLPALVSELKTFAMLQDALKAQGFSQAAGRVHRRGGRCRIQNRDDGVAAWEQGDATIVVTGR